MGGDPSRPPSIGDLPPANCCLQHFDMASKVILVTGGNKGIGLAIVETLLKQLPEALVLLGSRDAGRGEDAVASVKAKLGSGVEGRVKLLLLDVTSQESVDRALEVVKAEHSSIYGVHGYHYYSLAMSMCLR